MNALVEICGRTANLQQVAGPVLATYATAETLIKYKGWFNIPSKSKKYVSGDVPSRRCDSNPAREGM